MSVSVLVKGTRVREKELLPRSLSLPVYLFSNFPFWFRRRDFGTMKCIIIETLKYLVVIIIIIIIIIIISLFYEDNILSMCLSNIWSST